MTLSNSTTIQKPSTKIRDRMSDIESRQSLLLESIPVEDQRNIENAPQTVATSAGQPPPPPPPDLLPPPPPPPPGLPPPPPATTSSKASGGGDMMSQLQKASQGGLKKVEPVEKPVDERSGLLNQIKMGKALRTVTDDMKQKPKPKENEAPMNAAEVLAQFMDKRV